VGGAREIGLVLTEWLTDVSGRPGRSRAAQDMIRRGLGAADRAAELVNALRSTEGKRARIKG
jgi:hypothetical protein